MNRLNLADLLDLSGLGDLDYASLISGGNLVITTGTYATGTATNNAAAVDTRVYVDPDGFGGGGASTLIATLEDTSMTAGDFLV